MNALKTILTGLLFITTTVIAQTKTTSPVNPCEELKKENEALKKSLNINEPITILTDNDIEFKITKVKGDIKTQMVTIELLLTNKIKNREIGVTKGAMKIVSVEGDVLTVEKYLIPEQQAYDMNNLHVFLNTDIPIKCSFTFGALLSSNKFIKLFNLPYVTFKGNAYEQENAGINEFKDLKIDWK